MSIQTLKRKTAAKFKTNSSARPQFSLYGTRRSQGYVGQDTLGRSLPKTIMKGNVAKGHGGCCGKYPIRPIIQSAVTSLNNPKIIKSTVFSTSGMLTTKHRWIRRPRPFSMTKSSTSFSQNNFTQSQYIENMARSTIAAANLTSCQPNKYIPTKCAKMFMTSSNSQHPGKTKACFGITKDLTNPIETPKYRIATIQSEYLRRLKGGCESYDKKFDRKNRGAPTFGHCYG